MKYNPLIKGKSAEKTACEHLIKNGLKLVETNFYSRYGEIDIIMQHKQTRALKSIICNLFQIIFDFKKLCVSSSRS